MRTLHTPLCEESYIMHHAHLRGSLAVMLPAALDRRDGALQRQPVVTQDGHGAPTSLPLQAA